MARHTRSRGALRNIFFSIRSEFTSILLVAPAIAINAPHAQLFSCSLSRKSRCPRIVVLGPERGICGSENAHLSDKNKIYRSESLNDRQRGEDPSPANPALDRAYSLRSALP